MGRGLFSLALVGLISVGVSAAPADAAKLRVRITDSSVPRVLRSGRLHVRVSGSPRARVRVAASIARPRNVRLGRRGTKKVSLRLSRAARKRVRAAAAGCKPMRVVATARAHRVRARTHRTLSGGGGCKHIAVHVPGQGPPASSGSGAESPVFQVGAAVADFTPPKKPSDVPGGDASDCDPTHSFPGTRDFAFEEPYVDQNNNNVYDPGEPYLDCNANGRWDGNLIGGGSDVPRYYNHVADPVTSRAMVVSNGSKTIAVEVTDQEGLFNTYADRIRTAVAAAGVKLDGIYISATHDESAPDSLGLGGVSPVTSGTNNYFIDWLVAKSAQAIVDAAKAMRPAHIRFADALEPANMRECWSSYPFVDDQIMPVLQAVGTDGKTIVTLASVSQHAETLGFNSDATEKRYLTADWPFFFRQSLEQRYGGVGIEMAGSVGSVESPEVFSFAISRVPQEHVDGNHPAGCRTLFDPPSNSPIEKQDITDHLGYQGETRAFGEQLATAVGDAIDRSATLSASSDVWGDTADVCIPLTNQLFGAAATAGVFAQRNGYADNCMVQDPVTPNGSTSGNEILTQVAAFRIGDGEFIALPGEVFPFTYFRSFLGPDDMPKTQSDGSPYPLPQWPLPHMNTPYRFMDGLAEDMIGYIFPKGNGVGVPGEDPMNPQADSGDKFGCGHSDDSESANSDAGSLLADKLVPLLDKHGSAETVVQGRYVLPDGTQSRDPLGGPVIKCSQDTTYKPNGPALAVDLPKTGIVHPAAWMSLDGRPQSVPDRNTRGYFSASGERVWLDVFPDVTVP